MECRCLSCFDLPGSRPGWRGSAVISKLEDEIRTLSRCRFCHQHVFGKLRNVFLVSMIYDQDIDKAYDDLKRKAGRDQVGSRMMSIPTIIEMDINDTPSITLAVNNDSVDNLY